MAIVTSVQKVLLDTDIGTDIDDAVSLLYLLLHPGCDLMGVTTVAGEPTRRAMVASAICRWLGREVPIFPGASEPLRIPQRQKNVPQAEKLRSWDHATIFPRGEATGFLQQTIRRHPGEIILLAIGPLTNLGLLFGTDPEIPSLLRGLVLMCGSYALPGQKREGEAEWNAGGDPHAAAIVYRAGAPMHRSVGLNVTRRVSMAAKEFRGTFGGVRNFRPVMDFSEAFFREAHRVTFHDPLAAASIFDERICRFGQGTVEVELTNGEGCGQTRWHPGDATSPHQVAMDVDPARFFRHLNAIVGCLR